MTDKKSLFLACLNVDAATVKDVSENRFGTFITREGKDGNPEDVTTAEYCVWTQDEAEGFRLPARRPRHQRPGLQSLSHILMPVTRMSIVYSAAQEVIRSITHFDRIADHSKESGWRLITPQEIDALDEDAAIAARLAILCRVKRTYSCRTPTTTPSRRIRTFTPISASKAPRARPTDTSP